jgi:hypothetical protein
MNYIIGAAPIYIIYTIGSFGFFLYINNKLATTTHQTTQTDMVDDIERLDRLVQLGKLEIDKFNVKEYKSVATQCELDLLKLREDMEMEIIQTPSSNYRWFLI